MIEKLDKLQELNEKFYAMFGRLFKNRKLLDSDKTYKYFGERLFEQYKAEYEALRYNYEIKELPELEAVKQRHHALVPKLRRVWYTLFIFRRPNRALKILYREMFVELEEHFRKKEAALVRLEEALDKQDETEQPAKLFEESAQDDEQKP